MAGVGRVRGYDIESKAVLVEDELIEGERLILTRLGKFCGNRSRRN